MTDVSSLKGRTIAVAQGSSSHYTLVALLLKAGLSPTDVHLGYLQPADALAAFNSGKVDAWAVWDPYTAIAEQAGGHILATGQGLTAGPSFVVASDGALADSGRRKLVADYLQRLRAAQQWAGTHPEPGTATTRTRGRPTGPPGPRSGRPAPRCPFGQWTAAGLRPPAASVDSPAGRGRP